MNIVWIGSPNFTDWRPSNPQFIVDHWTVGSAHAAEVRFLDPNQKVSAHYLVKRDGTIDQFVDEQFTAWHSGGQMYNYLGIGIEHEHFDEDADTPGIQQDWPAVQLAASAELHADISARWNIPLIHRADGISGVLGHRETGYATQCPGTLPIDQILTLAAFALTEEDMTLREDFEAYKKETTDTINDMKKVYDRLYHHIDVEVPGTAQSSEPLFPPQLGAIYSGDSEDGKDSFWQCPDGTFRNQDGVEVPRPVVT